MSKYFDTGLAGWDYVFAISEEQVNNGLAIAYRGHYKGPQLPEIPKRVQFSLGTPTVTLTLGCPKVHASRLDMLLCDLVIPIGPGSIEYPDRQHLRPNESVNSAARQMYRIDQGATLRISCSLASVQALVTAGDGGDQGRSYVEHTVFVDFKSKKAVYRVEVEDGWPEGLPPKVLGDLLQTALQSYTGREYCIGSFRVPADAGPFVPRLMEFCFVLNVADSARNAFVICASLDDERAVENNLVFKPQILPEAVPAALWVGERVVMERMALAMAKGGLAGLGDVKLVYDRKTRTLSLAAPIPLAPIEGHTVALVEFSVKPGGGRLQFHSLAKSYGWTYLNLDVWGWVDGHIAVEATADRASFTTTSAIDANGVGKTELLGWKGFLEWLLTVASFGGVRIGVQVVMDKVTGAMKSTTVGTMGLKLQDASHALNVIARGLPAMEDLSAQGHLVFDAVVLQDSGTVCVGIRGTRPADESILRPPTGLTIVTG